MFEDMLSTRLSALVFGILPALMNKYINDTHTRYMKKLRNLTTTRTLINKSANEQIGMNNTYSKVHRQLNKPGLS